MTCCSSDTCDIKKTKRQCPICKQLANSVDRTTILQHIKEPWNLEVSDGQYFFCATPDCSVVYFSDQNKTIEKNRLRTAVGIKEAGDDAMICYCFGVNRAQAQTDRKIKDFVVEQTRASACSCEITNPSGRCCLKDFPKFTSPDNT